nr:MAG TPA: hypothetical protein [Caudoviricetes sp.]
MTLINKAKIVRETGIARLSFYAPIGNFETQVDR